ncbi:protein UsfY [Mycobacterium sp.]|uniref:protein UsfY n=1 Tax=Mycobacterium sp. TaxID=1785 RepID=UPI003D0B9647
MTVRQNPTDHARTTHQRAGEWFKNSRDAVGLFLLAIAVVAMVACLAAAAYGSTGWSFLMGGIAGFAGITATAWLLIEGRRVRRVEAKRSADLRL